MYVQENVRNNEPPKYFRLKTIVRGHTAQRNGVAQLQSPEWNCGRRSSNQESKGREVSVGRKVGACYQWKAFGQCSKGDSCSFSHDRASGNRRDQKPEGQSSSPAPKAQAHTDGKIPSKSSGRKRESPSGKGGRIAFRSFVRERARSGHVIIGTLPCLSIYKSESGCTKGEKCRFWHVEVDGEPSKKVEEKWCQRTSCLTEGVYTKGLCVSRFPSEQIYFTWIWKIGNKTHRQILQGPHGTT